MSIRTDIHWCDSTVNPTNGCDGCELWNRERGGMCYAAGWHGRFAGGGAYPQPFHVAHAMPGRMARAAAWSDLRGHERPDKPWLNGLPRMIFVGDMGDVFSRAISFAYLREEVLGAIESERGRRHFWIICTKRPSVAGHFTRWLNRQHGESIPDNVMVMTSLSTAQALPRVEELRRLSCRWRGLSIEPMLGPIDLSEHLRFEGPVVDWPCKIAWVIFGFASGPKAPAGKVNWIRAGIEACREAQVPAFVKQLGHEPWSRRAGLAGEAAFRRLKFRDLKGGNPDEWPEDLRVRQMPDLAETTR